MTPPAQLPVDRRKVRALYFALLGGLAAIGAVFGSLFSLGTAPLFRGTSTSIIAVALGALAVGPLLLGWFWARPKVPRRRRGTSAEEFWRDPEAAGRALLLWVLFEGATITGAVGTLLTGSLVTLGIGLLGITLLVTNGPGLLEERET